MAITPEQAGGATPIEARETKRLESIIDKHLRTTTLDFQGGRGYNLPSKVPEKVVDALIHLYRAAGWDVKLQRGDQREPGDTLYFLPAGSRRHYGR